MKTNGNSDSRGGTSPLIANKAIDDAIDHAVRMMTSREPAPGLDGRVLARLEPPTRGSVITVPRLVAVGLAAAVLIAVVMTSSRAPVTTGPSITTNVPTVPPAPRSPESTRRVRDVASGESVRQATRTAPRTQRTVNAASLEPTPETTVTVPALEVIEPIQVTAVRPVSMHMSEIAIEPIQVAPLRVEPLSSTPH
jgi:hypothetical protein